MAEQRIEDQNSSQFGPVAQLVSSEALIKPRSLVRVQPGLPGWRRCDLADLCIFKVAEGG